MANYAVSCDTCKSQSVCKIKLLMDDHLINPNNNDFCPHINIRCKCKRYINGTGRDILTGYSSAQNFCDVDKFMDSCAYCKTRDLCRYVNDERETHVSIINQLKDFLDKQNISDCLSFSVSCIAHEK